MGEEDKKTFGTSLEEFSEYQSFLTAEFEYIAQTAFQANEDRARVSEFFLISFGTFLAALLSSQLKEIDQELIYTIFPILFGLVTFLGAVTVLELSRLRQAWMESVRAMNVMKEHLSDNTASLKKVFRWKTDKMPRPFKPWSVGFLKSLQVSVLSGISSGTAAIFISLTVCENRLNWWLGSIVAILVVPLIMLLYYLPLRKEDKKWKDTRRQEKRVENENT
jgi:hypothetical protein